MIIARGGLGYGITSVLGAVVAGIFAGVHYASIFATLMLSALVGGAVGPYLTGALHDRFGSYTLAFAIAVGLSGLSAPAIWHAAQGAHRRRAHAL